MIKNIFIPEEIGTYFVIPQRILSIEITKTIIRAALIKAQGKKRIISKLIQKNIDSTNFNESVINSLKEIKTEIKFDKVYTLLPSSSVIFKDLSLPIIGHKKIKLIVPFEIESALPFSLDGAIIDTIVINENKQTQKTDLFVAATKESNLKDFLSLFTSANLVVDRVSVDIFELYGLYKFVYPKITSRIQALIDIGYDTTKVAILAEGKLRYIRIINKGLTDIANKIPVSTQTTIYDRLAYLFKIGVSKGENNSKHNTHNSAAEHIMADLINEINFSINTYLARHYEYNKVDNIILMGSLIDVPNIQDLVTQITQTPCQLFEINKIMQNENIDSKVLKMENGFLTTVSNGLALTYTSEFNLQQILPNPKEEKLTYYRLLTALSLALFAILSFSLYGFFRVRNLKQQYNQSQREPIDQLKKIFGIKKESDLRTLESANKAAKRILNEQSSAGKLLSEKNRTSLLRYLIELSKCINLKETQLDISQINIILSNIESAKIEIFGQVNNYAQLNKLQNQLACPLFKAIPKLQELNFKQVPITLEVKEEES